MCAHKHAPHPHLLASYHRAAGLPLPVRCSARLGPDPRAAWLGRSRPGTDSVRSVCDLI